jgi:hypothetical protein
MNSISGQFFAFAIETTGGWAKENSKLVDRFIELASSKFTSTNLKLHVNNLTRKISLDHSRQIASQILRITSTYKPDISAPSPLLAHDLHDILFRLEASVTPSDPHAGEYLCPGFEQGSLFDQESLSALPIGEVSEAMFDPPGDDYTCSGFEQELSLNQISLSALPSGSVREASFGLPVEDLISPGEVSEVYDVYDIIGGRPLCR